MKKMIKKLESHLLSRIFFYLYDFTTGGYEIRLRREFCCEIFGFIYNEEVRERS